MGVFHPLSPPKSHLFTLDADAQDTEAKTNIVKNARLLMGRIEDNLASVDEIIRFGAYLVQRCFLVAFQHQRVKRPSEFFLS